MENAVIIGAVRTPVGKREGALTGVHPVDLLATPLAELVSRTGVDPLAIDDHIAGCVGQIGEQSLNVARNAWLAAGLPEQVPSTTIDRQCGSSQQAVAFAAQGIQAGAYDLVVASGLEHMTAVPMYSSTAGRQAFSDRLVEAYDGKLVHQGISADLIAERWKISRDDQDDFAFRSHERAAGAIAAGHFDEEIVAVATPGGALEIDECVRMEPDRARMGTLGPAFRDPHYDELFPDQLGWTITAANASQISDGAGALMLASASTAHRLGMPPLARVAASVVVGDDPVMMLTGPIPATRKLLDSTGLALSDIDIVEINEAFASVVLAWQRELGIDDDWFDAHVNPLGGAIALGHPLGASGARLMTTLVHSLQRTGGRWGLQVMCEAGGMANATLVERL
ncbi:MAG: acetyl-CoA C-acyltransferase [Actinomycetota bacterium]|nr:acetyl-CoA C-acyltransferase [Actinomycetota bacterium]MDH5225096.1 acetyl-CoA C-acyltransferase [Actinomycetota bacterium]